MIVGTVDDATAAAASAADTGMDADTDPSPAVVASPTTEHISSFLLHIRRQAADDAASSSPDMAGGSADGATAAAVSATDDGMHVDTDATPPSVADGPHISAHSHADEGDAVAARSAREAAIPAPKKRRSSCGPAHKARRKAFYAASSSPDMAGGSADGVTAAAAPAAGIGMHVDTDPTPPAVADGPHTSAHSRADDDNAVAPCSAWETAVPSPKKRRSSRGPAYEARRKAFNASTMARTTSAPPTRVGAGTEGADGRGVWP